MIKKTYLIEKRNLLNEIRANNMTLQELRFFSIYLAKINSRDISSRKVRFPLSEFQRIMEIGRLNIKYIKTVTDSLLCKIISLFKPNGGFTSFQLFKECDVDLDEDGCWYIEIDAHDKALPLMFEFKEKYFTYHLWNALKLKSTNQLRMYEILKQYEKTGERIISIDELRALIGIESKEYLRWERFKTRVLDSCQKALAENTDIKFTYEPIGKKGRGGKILTLKFNIFKNDKYKDKLSLAEFLGQSEGKQESEISEESSINEDLALYAEICNNEFNMSEIQILYNITLQIIPYSNKHKHLLEICNYLKRKYDELNYQSSRRNINNRFGYLKKIIEVDVK